MKNAEASLDMTSLVARTFIRTSDCIAAQEAFNKLLKIGPKVGGLCLLLAGESGVGKSTLLELFMKGFDPVRTSDGWFRPLLAIVVPASPTAISLFEAMLTALGDPHPTRGTRTAKKARVVKYLKEQKVRVLFLDDLQHFIDRQSDRVLFEASEALKELLVVCPLCVVCAGLSAAKLVVKSNEQLCRRHMRTVNINRFDWRDEKSRSAFIGVLSAFAKRLGCAEMPDVRHQRVALRFYLATGGIMDFVAKLFICVAEGIAEKRWKVLTLGAFADAWSTMLFHADDEAENPFVCDVAKDVDIRVARALQINAVVPAPKKKRPAKSLLQAVGL